MATQMNGIGPAEKLTPHHAIYSLWTEGCRCMTRNNLAVLAMLAGLGVYLHQASQTSDRTLGYYLVAMYGSDAEKQSLINEVALEQSKLLHLRAVDVQRLRQIEASGDLGNAPSADSLSSVMGD